MSYRSYRKYAAVKKCVFSLARKVDSEVTGVTNVIR